MLIKILPSVKWRNCWVVNENLTPSPIRSLLMIVKLMDLGHDVSTRYTVVCADLDADRCVSVVPMSE